MEAKEEEAVAVVEAKDVVPSHSSPSSLRMMAAVFSNFPLDLMGKLPCGKLSASLWRIEFHRIFDGGEAVELERLAGLQLLAAEVDGCPLFLGS